MTELPIDRRSAFPAGSRTLALISTSHFISHIYILLLPPLFVALRADLGWSYTEISLGIVAFNLSSMILQTPAGYLTDRSTPFAVLTGGLLLEATAVALAGFTSNLWMFVALFAVAGIGNTVFHPAHYSILSSRIPETGISGAYAVHTFAGFLGTAAAPVSLLAVTSMFGWRVALVVSGAVGIAIVALLAANRRSLELESRRTARSESSGDAVLLRPEVIAGLVMFAFLAATNSGVQGYVVAALVEGSNTPLADANFALSAFLVANAFSILLGGVASRYVRSQELLFCAGLGVVAATVGALAFVDLGVAGLIVLLAIGGFTNGVILPSRDLMIRAVTPEGQFGKVFGFVSTGFSIGATVAPAAFALFLDHGMPAGVFGLVVLFNVLCVALTVLVAARRNR